MEKVDGAIRSAVGAEGAQRCRRGLLARPAPGNWPPHAGRLVSREEAAPTPIQNSHGRVSLEQALAPSTQRLVGQLGTRRGRAQGLAFASERAASVERGIGGEWDQNLEGQGATDAAETARQVWAVLSPRHAGGFAQHGTWRRFQDGASDGVTL